MKRPFLLVFAIFLYICLFETFVLHSNIWLEKSSDSFLPEIIQPDVMKAAKQKKRAKTDIMKTTMPSLLLFIVVTSQLCLIY